MKNKKNGADHILDDDSDQDGGQQDFGMDGLARSLGLDITALAIKLALIKDRPPV